MIKGWQTGAGIFSPHNKYSHMKGPLLAPTQREGMGLLEYQAMEAHDGWLCSYIYYILAAGNSISSQLGNQYGMEKAGGPSHTKSRLPGHSPPASQAGRRVRSAL